ncbi:MAG: UDP-3-O-(3-hydroxymyristoyl)glucosamine N-acyltransferase [Saprospiraceae bacterium]|nr:UDP-3-O-(3-hydroxymyristoyl)glucosamine N-acyltransferase [Saprospiraceae bacterium]
MEWKASDIAALVQGTVEGDPNVTVTEPSKIEEGKPGTITFLANPKYESHLYRSQASIVLVSRDFIPERPLPQTLIRVDQVYQALQKLLEVYQHQATPSSGINASAHIHDSCRIDPSAIVGPGCILEEGVEIGANAVVHGQVYLGPHVIIGSGATIYPGVRVYHHCRIGKRCIIHSNAVIGSDGFGFVPDDQGNYQKIQQIGNVVLEDDVEIGSNTVIDRATLGSTRIGAGCKLDNLIQVAHNVEIGPRTVIAAQTGIAGSTKIGANCQIGGQVGIVGHIRIADGVRIQAQSGVAASIEEPGSAWYGSPAIAYRDYLKSYALFRKLPDLFRRLLSLEKELQSTEELSDQ